MTSPVRPVLSRIAALACAALCGLFAIHLIQPPASAQTPAQNGQPSKDVQDLQTALDDIDTMHVLLPLKLTPEQMDKIVAAITTAKADYDKKYAALSSAPLLKMADEIRDIRKKAIEGTPVPATFDDRIRAIQAEFNKNRIELDTANLVALGAAIKSTLTPEQTAVCTKMEVDAYRRNKKYNDKASDSQYFNAFVLDLFISNPRTPGLIREMRAARASK